MFLLLNCRNVGAPLQKLSRFGINISPNKAGMKNHTVVNLGEVVSISIIYLISDS